MAIVYGSISGQEPSTVTFKVRTVTVPQNSSNMQQELLTLADPESSLGVARVVAAAPDSTHYGVVVRQVGYTAPSTAVRVGQSTAADLQATVTPVSTVWAVQAAQSGNWTVRAELSSTSADNPVTVSSVAGIVAVRPSDTNWASSAGFHFTSSGELQINGTFSASTIVTVSTGSVRVHQSSAADLNVTVSGYSTIVSVSTGSVRVHQSSAADLQATVAQASTVWVTQARLLDGASNALESSTSAPSTGARGLIVRPVMPGLDSYSDSTTGQSSATTILSSAAASRGYVYAISVISTLGGPVAWGIYAGATRKWGGVLAAVSSAVSGAVIAVSPPAYLCAGSTGEPLTFNCESSNRGLNVSLGYWQST